MVKPQETGAIKSRLFLVMFMFIWALAIIIPVVLLTAAAKEVYAGEIYKGGTQKIKGRFTWEQVESPLHDLAVITDTKHKQEYLLCKGPEGVSMIRLERNNEE